MTARLPSSGLVPVEIQNSVDARLLMAFAAGLEDDNPCFLDTSCPDGIVAHPLFPVTVEWPCLLALMDANRDSIRTDQLRGGVHAGHYISFRRLLRPDETVRTTGTIVTIGQGKSGAFLVLLFETFAEDGTVIVRTFQRIVYRGVELEQQPFGKEAFPSPCISQALLGETRRIEENLPAFAAHTYTECTRIWNPIHTDKAVALAAGLPSIILHGTATLARAISRLLCEFDHESLPACGTIAARFCGIVPLPNTLTVNMTQQGPRQYFFDVERADGEMVIADGCANWTSDTC